MRITSKMKSNIFCCHRFPRIQAHKSEASTGSPNFSGKKIVFHQPETNCLVVELANPSEKYDGQNWKFGPKYLKFHHLDNHDKPANRRQQILELADLLPDFEVIGNHHVFSPQMVMCPHSKIVNLISKKNHLTQTRPITLNSRRVKIDGTITM